MTPYFRVREIAVFKSAGMESKRKRKKEKNHVVFSTLYCKQNYQLQLEKINMLFDDKKRDKR